MSVRPLNSCSSSCCAPFRKLRESFDFAAPLPQCCRAGDAEVILRSLNAREERLTGTNYYVVEHPDGWMLKINDRLVGPYADRAAAIDAAIDGVRRTHNKGQTAQVLVQDADGLFRTEWTYGYPPTHTHVRR
jgi:hypothetical protein